MRSLAETIKAAASEEIEKAHERHRSLDDPFEVVAGLSDGVDRIVLGLFDDIVGGEKDRVALVAVGGYGRRELCPRSDVDLLFVRDPGSDGERVERMVRALWDGGFQLGHAVRTPEETFAYMCDDLTTANAMLEARFLGGSRGLYDAFLRNGPERYRRTRRDAFIASKREVLRKSIEDPGRTIYVVEPNLKEGACTLRDIQRVLWIENMRRGGSGSFGALFAEGRLPADELGHLRDAYGFYLRLRCDIHFSNKVKQDILERDAALGTARNLGYGRGQDDQAALESLMGDYYRHARRVYRFLRFYLEAGARRKGFFRRLFRKLSAKPVTPHLSAEEGRLTLIGDPAADGRGKGMGMHEFILEVFLRAQEESLRLSETLCDWIRREASRLDPALFQTPEAIRILRRILQRGTESGRILKALHETEVLGRVLPEFGSLTCLVSYDGHHQFTVDEHTLRALEELDRIESDPEYPEDEFRGIFAEVKDPLPLRMALLLHDTGKAAPGDHSVSGTEASRRICEKLGLEPRVTEVVDFLIYRHLELYRVSGLRDFNEEGVIESLAKLVETEERLRMLYLLTYVDIVSVGPGTWTHWKGAQLAEVYQRTLIHLRTGTPVGDTLEIQLQRAGLEGGMLERVVEHCNLMGPSYVREILPERMLYHLRLVQEFQAKSEMQAALQRRVGYDEITFCGADRARLFADLTGLLFSEGLNVLGAQIYSRTDGTVLDLFQVEVADTLQLSTEERVDRIRKKLRRIESKRQVVEDFIRQRTQSYLPRRWRIPLFGPSVTFDNESSPRHTVIEVSAGDRPGLLYDLAHEIHRLGLDLRTAKVSTLLDRAHDAFYVLERDGRKVDNPARRTEIVAGLKSQAEKPAAALRRGA
jgi:[protein-PII] uridylyltransferase